MAFTPEEARKRKLERQKKYNEKTGYASQRAYNKERGKAISFRLFTPQDDEVIAWLNRQPNKAGYLKSLIKEDMKRKINNL